MGKIRKRKKDTSFLSKFATFLFSLSILALFLSSLFLGSLSTSLTMEIQNMQNEIEALKNENEKLSINIASLENKDRVYDIAIESGLVLNQDNIIYVRQGQK